MNTLFFSESCSESARGTGKTCRDTEPIPGIGEQELSSAGNIHHPELQNEINNFEGETISLQEHQYSENLKKKEVSRSN